MTTAVAKKEAAALAQDNLRDLYAGMAGEGMEKVGAEDLALPFIALLQQLSPQVNESDERFIDGAKAGLFMNTVTGKLTDKLLVVPVYYDKSWVEWIPRDSGGGFVASYGSKEDAARGMEQGNDIVETGAHYLLVISGEGEDTPIEYAVLTCTSSKLKVSRQWNSIMAMQVMKNGAGDTFTLPSFAKMYTLSSVPAKNRSGQAYFNIAIELVEGLNEAPIVAAAKDFRKAVAAGTANIDYNRTESDAAGGNSAPPSEDEQPFK